MDDLVKFAFGLAEEVLKAKTSWASFMKEDHAEEHRAIATAEYGETLAKIRQLANRAQEKTDASLSFSGLEIEAMRDVINGYYWIRNEKAGPPMWLTPGARIEFERKLRLITTGNP